MIDLELDPFCREFLLGTGFDFSVTKKCPLRVLLVSDNASFGDGNGLHLSELIRAMTEADPFLDVQVDIAAHRSCDFGCNDAEILSLDFSTHDLSIYDEIWLFGVKVEGEDLLPKPEVDAIVRFMQAGGGVFAVGDHGTHGRPLCGGIPRVRSMRRWSLSQEPISPDMDDSRKIDTVVGDECLDAIPQTILPRIYRSPYDWAGAQRSSPHPVLCGPLGPISVLPDHKHEGLVEVPENLDATYELGKKVVQDYPHLGGQPLAPEVIAKALNQRDGSCFGAIGVFDGHLLKSQIGRVAVDSTWHHFVNMNLNQFRCHHDSVVAALERGIVPNPRRLKVAEHYIQIRAYFRNLTRWLAKPSTQRCLFWRVLCALRSHTSILMVLRSATPDNPLPYFLDLGVKARQALRGLGWDLQFWSLSRHVGKAVGLDGLIGPFSHPFHSGTDNDVARKVFSAIDPELVACTGVGGAIHLLGRLTDPVAGESQALDRGFESVREGVAEAFSSVFASTQEGMVKLRGLI